MTTDIDYKLGIYTFKPSGNMIGRAVKAFREFIVKAVPKNSRPPKLLFDFHDVKRMDSIRLDWW